MRVAPLWREAGDEVFATTRGERRETLSAAGLRPITFDVAEPPPRVHLPAVDTVVFAVGRSSRSSATMSDIHVAGLQAVLDALPASTGRVIYVSSTSVYSQDCGEWVDETSSCDPATEEGIACRSAERLLFAHARGRDAIVMRLAGLYGEGRVPLAGRVNAGEPIAGSPDKYLNLIHVADAATAIVAAAASEVSGHQTFVLSDGQPVTRGEYVAALASRQGVVSPPFEGGGGLGKRVRNTRVLNELRLQLQRPSYQDGWS
jgi:nucleoside-diphosphate-sugar epimerase